jgi:protein-ribulosamine 3-kinase
MQLPPPVEKSLLHCFSNLCGRGVSSLSARHASGGSINDAAIATGGGVTLFVKWNEANRYPGMFEAEAKGLQLLADPGGALVPNVIEVGEDDDLAWLVLEYAEAGYGGSEGADRFGAMLARLHRNTHDHFGLDHNNYMGSLPQPNTPQERWDTFFILERLTPQIRLARDQGAMDRSDAAAFDRLFPRLSSLVPEEPPALVHGDLWSGNYISGAGDKTWLIDPAVAYNHRETDIAMSLLFGGFPQRFYEAYQRAYPLEPGWEERVTLHQLYPLMVHVNLFGGGYLSSVRAGLKRFIG